MTQLVLYKTQTALTERFCLEKLLSVLELITDEVFYSRGVAEADVLVSCQFVHKVHDLQSRAAQNDQQLNIQHFKNLN